MRYRVVTPPAAEPVSLAEARANARIDTAADDVLISALIVSARESAEHELGRSLITQTLALSLDRFPAGGAIELPAGPVQSVESLTYVDPAGITQTLPGAQYRLDSTSRYSSHWLRLVTGATWPAVQQRANAVEVLYVAGYGIASAVPQAIRQWILMSVGDMYANRERSAEKPVVEHGFARALLDPYRLQVLA